MATGVLETVELDELAAAGVVIVVLLTARAGLAFSMIVLLVEVSGGSVLIVEFALVFK